MVRPPLKLQVRYCGGCDPEIDRSVVVERLQEIAAAAGYEVIPGCDEPDVILLVNGCAHACTEREDHPVSRGTLCILVRGAQVDDDPIPEARLHEAIWERIRSLFTTARSNVPQ